MARNRHDWMLEERDAIRILFREYNLDADRVEEAYRVFSALFNWNHNLPRIRDEWRSRGKGGKSPTWHTIHDKALAAYSVQEQTRRAAVRVRIVQAASDLQIDLTPITKFAALHAAALATQANATVQAPTMASNSTLIASQGTGSTTMSGPGAPPLSTTLTNIGETLAAVPQYTQPQQHIPTMPVSTRSSSALASDAPTEQNQSVPPSKEDMNASTMPPPPRRKTMRRSQPRQPSEDDDMLDAMVNAPTPARSAFGTGPKPAALADVRDDDSSTSLPSTFAAPQRRHTRRGANDRQANETAHASGEDKAGNEDDGGLWMVHYIDLQVNRRHSSTGLDASEPHFQCARIMKFRGDKHPAYAFGGHAMRIIVDADVEARTPRMAEDVMVCNKDHCEMCFDSELEEELDGESPTFGLPFVHIAECTIGDEGILDFTPDLSLDYQDGADCNVEQDQVRFSVEGKGVVMQSAVCIAESCARCSPNRSVIPNAEGYVSKRSDDRAAKEANQRGGAMDGAGRSGGGVGTSDDAGAEPAEKSTYGSVRGSKNGLPPVDTGRNTNLASVPRLKLHGPRPITRKLQPTEAATKQLPMVHFIDLSHRNDVPKARYQALHSHKFVDDSPSYLRGGQLYTVYFYASDNLPVRFEDVIICWDRACETCSPGFADAGAAPPGGLSFVHLASDTYGKKSRPVDELFFQLVVPERGLEWDTSDIPRGGEKVVICNSGGEKVRVRVEVCDLETCRRCHPDDVDTRSFETKELFEKQKLDWNARQEEVYLARGLAATGPDYRPAQTRAAEPDQLPPTSKRATNALRMCHFMHLMFEEDVIRFDCKGDKSVLVDQYFLPTSSKICAYGGPILSVEFPDQTTRDVVCCFLPVCVICTEPGKVQHDKKTRWGAEGFVHRRELDIDVNADNETSSVAFTLNGVQKYEVPGSEVEFEKDRVACQSEDERMKETECWVCVEGTCEECDVWHDAKAVEEDEV